MQMIAVTSSNLAAVGYENGTLRILFNSGGIYDYINVPQSIYNGLMSATSKGNYHAAYIKNVFQFRKIR